MHGERGGYHPECAIRKNEIWQMRGERLWYLFSTKWMRLKVQLMENRSLTVHKTLPGGVGDGESGWAVLEKKTLLAYNN